MCCKAARQKRKRPVRVFFSQAGSIYIYIYRIFGGGWIPDFPFTTIGLCCDVHGPRSMTSDPRRNYSLTSCPCQHHTHATRTSFSNKADPSPHGISWATLMCTAQRFKTWQTRKNRGKPLANPWEHGNPWEAHGKPMGNPWETHGKAMGSLVFFCTRSISNRSRGLSAKHLPQQVPAIPGLPAHDNGITRMLTLTWPATRYKEKGMTDVQV